MTLNPPDSARSLANAIDGVPERFVPEEMQGQLVEAEHVVRYWWATRFCSGRRTLDAGCGIGYGSAILKLAGAPEVAAVDVADEIVEVARQHAPDGVTFATADVAELPYADNSFALVVCFEVIEHVERPDVVLDELARVLAPGGVLLISSPNRARYVPGNPHHRHEYQPDELRGALRSRFRSARLLAQHVMIASVIDPLDGNYDRDSGTVRRLVERDEDEQTYNLAMAGDELPDPGPPLVALTQFVELRKWLEHYEEQSALILRQKLMLDDQRVTTEARNRALNLLAEQELTLRELPELHERVRLAEEDNGRLRGDLRHSGSQLADAQARLAQADRVLLDVLSSPSWRLTSPLRALKRIARRARPH